MRMVLDSLAPSLPMSNIVAAGAYELAAQPMAILLLPVAK